MISRWVDGLGGDYHDTVWNAVTDAGSLASFRRNKTYTDIVGVADYFGYQYLDLIFDEDIKEILAASEMADLIGEPLTYDYGGNQLSPNTLRYAKVLQDIVHLFPRFSQYSSTVEIGVGYGGQARMVSEYAKLRSTSLSHYVLIDMLPVCFLAQAYLDNVAMRPCCQYLTKSQIPRSGKWDFFLSNYAFSEFDVGLQREYLELVVTRCGSGYLTMNTGLSESGQWKQASMSAEELLIGLPNAALLPEDPLTYPSNYIIVFGDHAAGRGTSLADMRHNEKRSIEHFEKINRAGDLLRRTEEADAKTRLDQERIDGFFRLPRSLSRRLFHRISRRKSG